MSTNFELFAKASHDLKAPLRSLDGLINLAATSGPEGFHDYILLMRKSIAQIDEQIHRLMNYSSKSDRNGETVSLNDSIQLVLDNHRFLAPDVSVECFVDPNLAIYTDPFRLELILNNLVSNAFKYQRTDNPHPFVKVKAFAVGSQVVIEVMDNGMGIADVDLNHVFEDGRRATVYGEGSGVGLYLLQQAVTQLGAKVEVRSVLGQGTCFRVTLPANVHWHQPVKRTSRSNSMNAR
ncbi:MAG: sensor histidine kinase [Cyclobacteriaceae bacterium]